METNSLITNNDMDEEGSKQKNVSQSGSDDSDVSEPIRLRYSFLRDIETDWGFLYSYHMYFLPIITIFSWGIFFMVK
jgi:hypothetical protein